MRVCSVHPPLTYIHHWYTNYYHKYYKTMFMLVCTFYYNLSLAPQKHLFFGSVRSILHTVERFLNQQTFDSLFLLSTVLKLICPLIMITNNKFKNIPFPPMFSQPKRRLNKATHCRKHNYPPIKNAAVPIAVTSPVKTLKKW